LDDSSAAALEVLCSDGSSDSDAVRAALRAAAAGRRLRSSIVAEVQRLAIDEQDRAEMVAVREQMADLAPQDA
jgi:Arc/MetJ-type ribon-helix-helix transcriptional regulator